jgi:hypothetical protein
MHQKMWMQKARKKKAYLQQQAIAHQPNGRKGAAKDYSKIAVSTAMTVVAGCDALM